MINKSCDWMARAWVNRSFHFRFYSEPRPTIFHFLSDSFCLFHYNTTQRISLLSSLPDHVLTPCTMSVEEAPTEEELGGRLCVSANESTSKERRLLGTDAKDVAVCSGPCKPALFVAHCHRTPPSHSASSISRPSSVTRSTKSSSSGAAFCFLAHASIHHNRPLQRRQLHECVGN